MSDNYLRLIPTEPTWQPAADAARRALATLSSLVPGADRVAAELHDEVTFIDQGANFERLSCQVCQAEMDLDWWSEQMGTIRDSGVINLIVATPCCNMQASLNDLIYDWPAGFAKVELSVRNPQRGWLDEQEFGQVAAELGHPLRQVMAHY